MPAATLLVVAILAGALFAQDRRPVVGRVVDGAGRPLADAEVTFVWCAPHDARFAHDEVVTSSDAQGRFRAELARDAFYMGWAIGPRREDGRRIVSAPVRASAGGRPVEFAAVHAGGPVTLTLRGLAAWRAAEPTTLRIFRNSEDPSGIPMPLAPGAERVTLPVLPAGKCAVVVEDLRGEAIVTAAFGGAADAVVELPPPVAQKVRIEVDGRPAAGAMVMVRSGLPFAHEDGELLTASERVLERAAGETDAAGCITVLLPGPRVMTETATLGGASLVARAPGRGHAVRLWHNEMPAGNAGDGHHPDRPIVMTPPPALANPLQIVHGERALAGVDVLGVAQIDLQDGGSGADSVRGRTDENGALSLSGLPARGPRSLRLFIRGDAAADFLPAGARPALVELPGVTLARQPQRLDALRVLPVQVTDAQKGPAAAAMVLALSPGRCSSWLAERVLWHPLDAGGRADLLVPGTDLFLYALDGEGHALTLVRAEDGEQDGRPVALELRPLPRARFRCVDGDGNPVAGARLTSFGGTVPDPPEDARERFLESIADAFDFRFAMLRVSAADGSLDFPTLGSAARQRWIVFRSGQRASARVPFVPDGEVQQVRF